LEQLFPLATTSSLEAKLHPWGLTQVVKTGLRPGRLQPAVGEQHRRPDHVPDAVPPATPVRSVSSSRKPCCVEQTSSATFVTPPNTHTNSEPFKTIV
jgi:hypothetical protein